MQTEIHHPTDSGLLVDSVRVLSRFVQRAKGLVKDQVRNVQQTCRSRLRTARQVAQTLHRQLRRKAEDKEAQQKALYQKLIGTTEHMVRQSQQVMTALAEQTGQQAQPRQGDQGWCLALPLCSRIDSCGEEKGRWEK